jgi:hypothetical protein
MFACPPRWVLRQIKRDACVIDQNVKLAEIVFDKTASCLVRRLVVYVQLQKLNVQAIAVQFRRRFLPALRVPRAEQHCQPLAGELPGRFITDSLVRARHQRDSFV